MLSSSTRVVLDCRWFGRGGAGTVTSMLVRGLAQLEPPGRWVLWGPAHHLVGHRWGGAEILADSRDPKELLGQRGARSHPEGDLFVAMHQLRPIAMREPVLQLLHDTIPLHTARHRALRTAKHSYLFAIAHRSAFIVTPSVHARRCIVDELNVEPEQVAVLHYPIDAEFVARVERARHVTPGPRTPFVLCSAGRFSPHKNIDRLVDAFATTQFAVDGGRLVVLGGSPDEVARLQQRGLHIGVDLRSHVPMDELDRLYAAASALVCPSIEEGFGLPAWEARSVGLALATSFAGGLVEAAGPDAVRFDPYEVANIAEALDAVTLVGRGAGAAPTRPTLREFAAEYLGHIERTLARADVSGP